MRGSRLGVLAAAVFSCVAAHAAEMELGGALPDFHFAALRPLAVRPPDAAFTTPSGSLDAPTAVAPLPSLLDNLQRTRAAFHAGATVVHVFGEKSRNKGDWFIGFAPEGGSAQFQPGRKMIHWMMLKRTVHVWLAGESFSAYIQGDVSNRMQSRLVVAPDDRSGPASSWSIQELTDDGFEAGWPVALGGRDYRVFYTRDFNQNDAGDFSGWTGGRSITLVARDGARYSAFHWEESDIPTDAVLSVCEKPAFADRADQGPLALGLRRRADGALEIYDRSAAVARR